MPETPGPVTGSDDGRQGAGPGRPFALGGPAGRWAPLLVAVAGLVATAALAGVVWSQDRERQRSEILRDAQALQASLQSGVTRLEDRVRSVTALMANSTGYDPHVLARYDSLVTPRTTAPWRAVSVGPLLQRTEREQLQAWVASRRRDYDAQGYPAFGIFPENSPNAGMLAILGVQPASSRENVFGFDMMSEAGRRNAILQAAATGLVELSPPVTLSQDAPTEAPSLLLVSAFRRNPAPLGPFVDSLGVVATSFTPSALVTAALDRLGEGEARLQVTLLRDGNEILSFPVRGAAAPADPATGPSPAGPLIQVTALGDTHQWRVVGTLHPWDPVSAMVPGTALAGLLVTTLILVLLLRERGERKRLAAELDRQSRALLASQVREARYQRSEALGRLTGGIAHDFNNLLGVILGNLDLMTAPGMDDTDRSELREQAEQAAERAATLTQSLLTFGRRARLSPRAVEVGALLAGLTRILRTSVPENVDLHIRPPEDELWIRVDPVQLESAILNLVVNARDACRAGDRITVTVARLSGDEAPETLTAAGPLVCITVRDSGRGMPAEILEKATDPFFTTRPPGQGTGLGLATATGFLRQSGGELELESTPGQGTAVRLWIPEGTPGTPDEQDREAPQPATLPPGLRLLLVEDEAAVRDVMAQGLEAAGCRVRVVPAGTEALDLLASGERPDVILSDVVMPGPISGMEVAERARDLGIPVVLMSGYTGDARAQPGVDRADHFMRKPVRMDDLLPVLARLSRS